MFDIARLSRLIKLCGALSGGKGMTLMAISRQFRISRRTVFRDLLALEDIGVRLELVNGAYRLKTSLKDCRKRIATYQMRGLQKLMDAFDDLT